MAARRIAGPVAATVAALYLAPTPLIAFAEAPPRKSIYDELPSSSKPSIQPPKPRSMMDGPTQELASYIRRSRLFVHSHFVNSQNALDSAFDRYLEYEESVTKTISSLAPSYQSGEHVLPGVIYIAVSMMAGGVISRNRMFPIRFLTPLAAGVAASWYFIPDTTRNVANLAWRYEQKVPQVAEAHMATRKAIEESWNKTSDTIIGGRRAVEDKLGDARDTVESWVKKH